MLICGDFFICSSKHPHFNGGCIPFRYMSKNRYCRSLQIRDTFDLFSYQTQESVSLF